MADCRGSRPLGSAHVRWNPASHLDPLLRRNLAYDVATAFGAGLFTALVVNFLGVVARRQGADPLLLAVLTACPFAANTFAIAGGAWVPAAQPARYVAVIQGLGRGAFLFALAADTPAALVAMSFVLHLTLALCQPTVYEILRLIYPDRMRGRLMGLVRIVQAGTAAIAAPLAGLLMDALGHRALFALGAAIGLVGSLSYGRIRTRRGDTVPRFQPLSAFRVLAADRRYAWLVMAWVIWGFGTVMALPLYPIVLVDRLQASYGDVGALSLVLAASGLLAYLVWGTVVDRRGGAPALLASFVLQAATPVLYAVAPDVRWLALASAFTGVANGAMEIGWPSLLIRIAPPDQRPRYAALLTTVTGLRGLVAPFVGSALASATPVGVSAALLVAGAIATVGVTLLTLALPPLLARPVAAPRPLPGTAP